MRVKAHIVDLTTTVILGYAVAWAAMAFKSWLPVIIAAFIGLVVLVRTITNPKG